MSRETSLTFRQAVNSQGSDEIFILLITLDHETLEDSIRICSGGQNIVHLGDTYIYYPFDMKIPDDTADNVPQATLIIENITPTIITALRSISSEISVNIKLILASDPDTIEIEFTDMFISHISYNALTIEATIKAENYLTSYLVKDSFVPSQFPGLF
ncbi:MAG TPA: DUF1833 family protein [Clostridia bacterium]|nr:DUF1833 family protein [Clostridia bacterium]